MIEDASYELGIGDSWNLGNGYLLTLHDFGLDGTLAFFKLTKDRNVLSEIVAGKGESIYYRDDIEGESRIIIAAHIRDIRSNRVKFDDTYRYNYVLTEQVTIRSNPSDAILIIEDAEIPDQNGLTIQLEGIPSYTMMYKDFEDYVHVDVATPPLITPATIENLPPGTYNYRLEKVGYEYSTGTFEIEPYHENDVQVSMRSLPVLMTQDEKELVVGESIELRNDYKIILSSVDTSDSTITLTLIQNGIIIDNQKIKLYDSYTYENYIFANVKDVFKTLIDDHVVGVVKLGPVVQYSTTTETNDESESEPLPLNKTTESNQDTGTEVEQKPVTQTTGTTAKPENEQTSLNNPEENDPNIIPPRTSGFTALISVFSLSCLAVLRQK